MTSESFPRSQCIAWAAQADLLFLTVEMLRAPQRNAEKDPLCWKEIPTETLHELLRNAFGETCEQAIGVSALTLSDALDEAHQLVQQLDRQEWSDEYWRLFDTSQACSLNQASYIRRDKGTILGDLCGFYNAFGWQGSLTSGERPDHLLCQLEFTSMLLAMAAQAKDDEHRMVVTDALSQFTRLHMQDWLPSVCHQLVEATWLPYFGAVSQWLMLFWTRLTETNAWPVDANPATPLTPQIDPESPYECAAPDLIQLQVKAAAHIGAMSE